MLKFFGLHPIKQIKNGKKSFSVFMNCLRARRMPIVYCGQLFGKTSLEISSAGKSASKLVGISEDAGKPAGVAEDSLELKIIFIAPKP
jgi:hypothetical protein